MAVGLSISPADCPRAGVAISSTRGTNAQVEVVDFDGDGDMDLLVGGRISGKKRHGYVWLFRRSSPTDQGEPRPKSASRQF